MNVGTTPRRAPSRISAPVMIASALLAVSAMGASPQAIELQRQLGDVRIYLDSAASSRRERRRERFTRLTAQWRNDTRWLSSITDIAMHPAYQTIIGMGPDALALILDDLRTNSGYWFWALKAISSEDPVPPSDRGNMKRMKVAWLRWGEEKGIAIE